MKNNYEEFLADGNAYFKAAVNGQKRPEIFTPDIIYNMLAMAIEKFVMAALISKKMMADNHTFTDLVDAAAQISPFNDELVSSLKELELYQDLCPVFEGYNRDPFPVEKIPSMIKVTNSVKKWMNNNMVKAVMLLLISVFTTSQLLAEDVVVMAASSTTDVLKACAGVFESRSDAKLNFNFASSGTLARQISSGAPADIYISANIKWMDYLENQKLIAATSRVDIFSNRMVLIANKESAFNAIPSEKLNLPCAFSRRIAVGGMQSVPCGMYAKQIFTHYGWSSAIKDKLVAGTNVRQVLFFVERNEVDAGIVYATDAKASRKVKVITLFPEESHSRITYPAALCMSVADNSSAKEFMSFLGSNEAKTIFTAHGFEAK